MHQTNRTTTTAPAATATRHLRVIGWRFADIPEAVTTHGLLLSLLGQEGLSLSFRELPLPPGAGRRDTLFPGREADEAVASVPVAVAGEGRPDAILSLGPPDTSLLNETDRPFVFLSHLPAGREWMAGSGLSFITPSPRIREFLLAGNVAGSHSSCIPAQVDHSVFCPDPVRRTKTRKRLGFDGPVFLAMDATRDQDALARLLTAFATVLDVRAKAVLVLRSLLPLERMQEQARKALALCSSDAARKTSARIRFVSDFLAPGRIADLYRASDVLIAPFGDNLVSLPVLEGKATGLPAILPEDCAGEYVSTNGSLLLKGTRESSSSPFSPDPDSLSGLMTRLVQDVASRLILGNSGRQMTAAHSRQEVGHQLDELLFPVSDYPRFAATSLFRSREGAASPRPGPEGRTSA